jgi:hypothetical protein
MPHICGFHLQQERNSDLIIDSLLNPRQPTMIAGIKGADMSYMIGWFLSFPFRGRTEKTKNGSYVLVVVS